MSRRRPLSFDPIAEAGRNWRAAGWDDAAPGMALVTSIMRSHQILLARVDSTLAPMRLTFARFEVLMLLDFSRSGRLPLSKIGQRLQVHAASVTNAVDRLESDGLVTRVPHPTDGRTTLAAITRAGRRQVHRAATALNAAVFVDVGLDAEHVDAVVTALAVLRRNAHDFALATPDLSPTPNLSPEPDLAPVVERITAKTRLTR
jgi:DNA-binding MarR family transcriptional regulator